MLLGAVSLFTAIDDLKLTQVYVKMIHSSKILAD